MRHCHMMSSSTRVFVIGSSFSVTAWGTSSWTFEVRDADETTLGCALVRLKFYAAVSLLGSVISVQDFWFVWLQWNTPERILEWFCLHFLRTQFQFIWNIYCCDKLRTIQLSIYLFQHIKSGLPAILSIINRTRQSLLAINSCLKFCELYLSKLWLCVLYMYMDYKHMAQQ